MELELSRHESVLCRLLAGDRRRGEGREASCSERATGPLLPALSPRSQDIDIPTQPARRSLAAITRHAP